MKITSSIEYATRLMAALALQKKGAMISADQLSESENIPADYVTQLLQRLRRAGLVSAVRGPVGGYSLARKSTEITLGEVIRAVEGQIFEEVCTKYEEGRKDCRHQASCGLSPVWVELGNLIEGYFDNITLSKVTAPPPCIETPVGGKGR